MRVVAGRLKGRVLKAPDSRAIRPTSERLRESIFDILAHRHAGAVEGRAGRRPVRRLRRAGDRGAVARRRLRAAGRQRRRRRARCCAPMSRPWVSAASPASGAPTRPSSAERRRAGRSASPSSIRPMARVSPARRWPGWFPAAGSRPARSSSSRRRRRPRSPRRRALEPIDARVYGDTQIAIFAMPDGG